MAFAFTFTIIIPFALLGIFHYRRVQRYKAEAKVTGFRYVLSPVFFQSIPWILLQEALLPLLEYLPTSITEAWLPLSLFYRTWHYGYKPFSNAGTDTFVISSPSGNVIWTCDPEMIEQVLHRRQEFIKPTDMLGMLNIYGPTITASEGEEHRKYRKIAAPSFNETTHDLVWKESIEQADSMVSSWMAKTQGHVTNLGGDASDLTLHVLSKVFFNKAIPWSDDSISKVPKDHQLSYREAIKDVFRYNDILFMVPKAILNNSPSEAHRKARTAYAEFKNYMEELRNQTEDQITGSQVPSGAGSLLENFVQAGMPEISKNDTLPPAAVLGNLFIFILAGHETSSNTLTHAITLLACRPDFQKALQTELDMILPRDRSAWSYSERFVKLWNGHVGALMQETMRLYPVLPFLPKINPHAQTIQIGQNRHHIPPNTLIMINTAAVHRHPKFWPPAPVGSSPSPLPDFHPERWLDHKPTLGSYIPFGEGYRSCMGQRFAQVELCATIAQIFSQYSVELENSSTKSSLKIAEEALTGGMRFEMGLKMGSPVPLWFRKRT